MSAAERLKIHDPDAPPPEAEPAVALTVADVIRLYLAHLVARVLLGDYRQRTLDNVRRFLDDFAIEAGPLPLSKVQQTHFTGWLTGHASNWSVRYRRDGQNTVLTAFRWGVDEALISRCPFKRATKNRGQDKEQPAFLHAHYVAFMRACRATRSPKKRRVCRSMMRAAFFLWHTGCRHGEMRKLKWDYIDFEERIVRLVEHKTAHITPKDRVFAFPEKVARLLKRMKAKSRSEYVFMDAYRRPWFGETEDEETVAKNSFCRSFRRRATIGKLPKDMTAHAIRRGWTVRAIEAGLSDKAIADQQGWETTRMVSLYGRRSKRRTGHLRNVADVVAKRAKRPE